MQNHHMKLLFALIAVFSFKNSFAGVRNDQFFFNHTRYNTQADTNLELGLGSPPIFFSPDTKLINTFYSKYTSLAPTQKLNDFHYAPLVIAKLSDRTTLTARGQLAFRNTGSAIRINNKSMFLSATFIFSSVLGDSPHWKWSYGLVIPEGVFTIPVIPAIGLTYLNPEKGIEAIIAFPVLGVSMRLDPKWETGALSFFENTANHQHNSDRYIGQRRVILTSFLKYNATNALWINARIGYTLIGKTRLLDKNFETISTLDNDRGVYTQIGVSFRFQ